MKVKIHFWVMILILGVLITFQIFLKDQSIERTIYFLLLVLIVSSILTEINSDKISLMRTTRESRQQVGQYFVERYVIENKKKQPVLWATIVDLSNISSKRNKKIIAWIPGRSSRDYIQRTLLEKRGIYTLGPTKLLTGDPFGFFEKNLQFDSIDKVIILPSYQQLRYFPEPTGYLSGGVARKTRNTEVSPYAVSVRDYYPGDPLRRIDWKTTARLGKLMVKEFEEDPQSTVWIFLDSDDQFMFEYKKEKQKTKDEDYIWGKKADDHIYWHQNSFEQQVSIAASICEYYIANNRFVGFYSNGKKAISISPEGGVRQLDKVLEMLASLTPVHDRQITELLLSQNNRLGNASTLVIISSNTEFEVVDTLKQLQQKKFSIILISIDPLSYQKQNDAEDFYSAIRSLGIKLIIAKNGQPLKD